MSKNPSKRSMPWAITSFCMIAALVALAGGDCDMGMTGGTGDPGGDPPDNNAASALIKTLITLGSAGKIDVGDDLIVYGIRDDEAVISSNQEAGIHYLVPSNATTNTVAGTLIPGSAALFGRRNFEVAQKKVALVRSTNAISIYDTVAGTLTDIPATDINIETFFSAANMPGEMASANQYIATINKTHVVTDGNAIKVIDVSGAAPTIISFPDPTDINGDVEDFRQVAIDGATHRVAAVSGDDHVYVFDIDNPAAAPLMINLSINSGRGNFSDAAQIRFDNGKILYHQLPDISDRLPGLGSGNAALLDVDTDSITTFTENPTNLNTVLALNGGSIGYSIWREAADQGSDNNNFRSAIGKVSTAPASTPAGQLDTFNTRPSVVDISPFTQADCVQESETIGYGATMCITPNGTYWFLAGWGPVSSRFDVLQMSTGGTFTDFADPGTVTGSVMATDVVCSGDIAAFRALHQEGDGSGCLTHDSWVLGFILVNQLDN